MQEKSLFKSKSSVEDGGNDINEETGELSGMPKEDVQMEVSEFTHEIFNFDLI